MKSVDRLTHFLNLEELDTTNVEKTMPEYSESNLNTIIELALFSPAIYLV